MSATVVDPWLRRFHASPAAGVRLACFPHAGGSASVHFPLSRALAPDVDVLCVQYPGRFDRLDEPPLTDVATLAEGASEALAGWSDAPLALFGHSLGALVAFETARRLRARGRPPVALIVSGRRPPQLERDEDVHKRSDAGVLAELRRLDGPGIELLDDPDIVSMLLPVIRADYQAAETYRLPIGDRLDCPMLVLNGDRDPRVDAAEASGWGEHTTAACEERVFGGGHFYLSGRLDEVAAVIRKFVATGPRPA